MRWEIVVVLSLALIAAGFVVASFIPEPRTDILRSMTPAQAWNVKPGESIQAAIDEAPAGAVILLGAGEWREHVAIGKSLTLRGEGSGATTIRGNEESSPIIQVHGDGDVEFAVNLVGVRLDGAVGRSAQGLLVDDNAQVVVADCIVSENGQGIAVRGRSEAMIGGCTLSGNDRGIDVYDSRATITDCSISGNETHDSADGQWSRSSGISATGSTQVTVTNCSISGDIEGVAVSGDSEATITDCIISGSAAWSIEDSPPRGGFGIDVSGSALAVIAECVVTKLLFGISISDSARARVDGCTVSESGSGMDLWGSAQATVDRCSFSRNGGGVHLWDESSRATIEMSNCVISGNAPSPGIVLEGYSQATVTGCDISDNSWGMKLYSASQATVTDSSVSKNKFDGVGLLQEPQITIIGSDISENGGHGISLWESTQATIERSKISRNGECGVFWHACRVIGGKNVIPNRDEPDGNGWGAFCSSGLSFLTTNEGGELDQRRAP